jgi:hypothetical protein
MLRGEMMKKKVVLVGAIIVVMSVIVTSGLSYFGAIPPETNNRLAVIEDEKGDCIGVEPISDEVWSKIVELFHSKEMMWIGGVVEEFINIKPDKYYKWGFRFKPGTIVVAEVTAEGLQTTIRGISADIGYWLDIGHAYVFAKVVDYLPSDVTKFKAVVNGMRDVDVFVHVDISNGLTREEAERIAEATFIEVMGESVMYRLDTLTFNDTQIKAHYTWGVNENDMGHVFGMTADLTTLQITATHCR